MNRKTLSALEDSITHWEEMLRDPDASEPDSRNCALCGLFFHHDCRACPVMAESGQRACRGTPYKHTATLHNNAVGNERIGHFDAKQWCWAATAEIEFLKSLLPQSER